MREILFRGKRVDNGEWVKGSLLTLDSPRIINNTDSGLAGYVVLQNTIGQFTGSTDKNGRKIFEGDIVSVIARGIDEMQNHCIEYNEEFGSFMANFVCGIQTLERFHDENYYADIRVIGNIYDTPELHNRYEYVEEHEGV